VEVVPDRPPRTARGELRRCDDDRDDDEAALFLVHSFFKESLQKV
jgi:hypothetical protein